MFDDAAAATLARHLIEALTPVLVLGGGQEIYIGTSIGICRFPSDGSNVDQLVRNADAALYEAKAAGRGGFRFYSPALTETANKRVSLESRLRRGLERNEFLLPTSARHHGGESLVAAVATADRRRSGHAAVAARRDAVPCRECDLENDRRRRHRAPPVTPGIKAPRPSTASALRR